MRATLPLVESRCPSETGISIGCSLARRSHAQRLPAFVIVPSPGREREASGVRAGCTSRDSEADSLVSTWIETDSLGGGGKGRGFG